METSYQLLSEIEWNYTLDIVTILRATEMNKITVNQHHCLMISSRNPWHLAVFAAFLLWYGAASHTGTGEEATNSLGQKGLLICSKDLAVCTSSLMCQCKVCNGLHEVFDQSTWIWSLQDQCNVFQTMYRHQTHLCYMRWMPGSVHHLCKSA